MTIVNPYSDIFVRYLLGSEENNDLLLSFINAVFLDSGMPEIAEVSISNPVNLKDFDINKDSILDVKGRDENGRWYDIEVQVQGNGTYIHRSLFYWSQLYSNQLKKGKQYDTLKPVIVINLLNFELIEDTKEYHSCFMISEKDNPEITLTDHLQIHYLELPKFFEKEEFKIPLKAWLGYFKYEGKDNEIMKTVLESYKPIEKAHKKFDAFTADERLIELYQARERQLYQYQTDLQFEHEKGVQEGFYQKAMMITHGMVIEGLPWSSITKFTNITEPEYKKWLKSNPQD